jgi:glycosyltransferase involved in cell wall biosynthesis
LVIAVNTRFLLTGRLEGFGWYTHEIMRRMVAAHPNDAFVFLFDRPFDPAFVYGPNVTPVVVPPPARHPVLFHIWNEWMVPRALKPFRPDVYFSPDSICSLRLKTPTLLTVHDLIPLRHPEQVARRHRRYYLKNLPQFIHRAEHIATVSEYVRRDIVETCGVSPDKVTAVYNGCRELFVPLSEAHRQLVRERYSDGKPYFFYVGAIHPRKNIPQLIRAFERFKNESGSPALLLLAGRMAWDTGEVSEALRQSAHRADIRSLGYVPEADLPQLAASALALTYISIQEGFGLPVVEAMYCDTPVIAAAASCLPEIAGDAALLVDPHNVENIATAMLEIHADAAFRAGLIEKGRLRRAEFSWDAAAHRLWEILCNV